MKKNDKLTEEEKKYIITCMKKAMNGDVLDNCLVASSVIYYILKEKCNIPDEYNKVIDCLFYYPGFETQHYYNDVYREYIDVTIEQFNTDEKEFSPFDDNSKFYKEAKVSSFIFNRDERHVNKLLNTFLGLNIMVDLSRHKIKFF